MRLWFVALLALSACGSDPRLRVDLRTDYVPRLEFVTVRTDIYADVDRTELELRAEFDLGDAQSAFEGVRIADARVGSGIKTLVVSLLERTGAILAERVIVVDVRGDTGVTALLTRNCEGVACPASIAAATQCLGGQCVTPDCTPETPENCPEPVCTTADDCPTGSSCTTPMCVSGACTLMPTTECGDLLCDPNIGCVAPPGECAVNLMPEWAVAPATETEFFVSPTGDDANPGTRSEPLQTTAEAFSRLGPGVQLSFLPGTYECASVIGLNATTERPAVIRSADAPRSARFDCASEGVLYFQNVHGLLIESIEVFGATLHGVHVASGSAPFDDPSTDVVFRDSFAHDVNGSCFRATQSQRIGAFDNVCDASGSQMFSFIAVDDVVVAFNEGRNGGGPFTAFGGASTGVDVVGNWIHDSQGIGISVGCTGANVLLRPDARYEVADLRVWNNLIHNSGSEAFRIVSCHDCVIAHNTYVTDAPEALIRFLSSGFSDGPDCDFIPTANRNVRVVNNIFSASSAFGYGVASNDVMGGELMMSNNIWYAGTDDIASLATDYPFAGEPRSFYSDDPFVNVDGARALPARSSVANGAGTPVDFATGNALGECWNGSPNIGAF